MKSDLVVKKVLEVFKCLDELRKLDEELEISSLGIALFIELFDNMGLEEEEFNDIITKYRAIIDGGK